jgi:hypothetical protein
MIDKGRDVNGSAYMEFREATDMLFDRVDHGSLARALGVSVASIRQARLRPDATAHRPAPPNWRGAVERLAERRIRQCEQLLRLLREEDEVDSTQCAARTKST